MAALRRYPGSRSLAGGSLSSDVSGYFDASDPGFVVRWEIVDSAVPTGIKTIAVRATALRETSGLPKSVELTTFRAR